MYRFDPTISSAVEEETAPQRTLAPEERVEGPLSAEQIATVEARHASYLNLINGAVPFPDAFDQPVAPRAVFDQAAAFITTPLTASYPPYETLGQFRGVLPDFVVGLEGVVPIPPAGL